MKKFLILSLSALTFALAFTGCGKETVQIEDPTEEPTENIVVIEATDQRVVTDPEEIENLVAQYGIPIESESIGRIVEAEIDASVFD
ncbi:MAG: hypothetical protein ACI3XA_00705 [Clostridia bacterium]